MPELFIVPSDTEMTKDLLNELIQKHKSFNLNYLVYKQLYEGNHAILQQKQKEQYKPDNRLVVNFAKYIVDTFNGYFIGVPVQTSHENKQVSNYLELLDGYNDQDDNNAELSKICSIYGHGYELIFNDENAEVGITYLTPLEAFIVYDDSIRQKPLFAVRYFYNKDGVLEGSYSDANNITYFKDGEKGLEIGENEPHPFDGVPMIEYVENEERQSLLASVVTLINAFNKAISEKANDVEYFADAYLKILGAELEDETLKSLRDTRIINLKDTDAQQLIVEFLQKPDADATQEHLLDRLENLIFRTAMVANISDESFGTASGIALRYRLQAMDNLAKTKERKFMSGMNRRYKLIASYPTSKIGPKDWIGIKYKFTRNLPANLLEESQIAGNLAGIVSEETQVGVLSIVENPQKEIEKKNSDKPTLISRQAGGLNGQNTTTILE
ncbi:phage portal protein [Streptococcus dysgalactiae]|uniref:phage portal protein n=1 Tax=Streptococcus dysgalactiae TaxID=1334 RepID=UPI0001AABBC7|nr:phage portal protein [Streptococcus dysgalactiae]BAH82126.1 portal protein [Streptococcus dysgalactiae subsp. equisimilis GGS_124]